MTLNDGSSQPGRMTRRGGWAVSQESGRYADAVMAERVFIGANAFGTAVTTQAGLSATTPALTLYNPVGSGVYGALLAVHINVTADPAAASDVCLAYNAKNATAPASTTDGTMLCARIGSTVAPKLRCYRVATLAAAPVAFWHLGQIDGGLWSPVFEDIAGAIILEEGVAISIQTRTAAAIVADFVWEEYPK